MLHKKNKKMAKNQAEFVDGRKEKEESARDKKSGRVKMLFFCVAGTVVLYAALVMMQASLVNDFKEYEVTAFVPARQIPANTRITEQNVSELFTRVVRDSRTLPPDYITDTSALKGQYTAKIQEPMEIICKSGFQALFMAADLKEPVEVSFQVSSYDQAVGGVLREGDRINLYVVKAEEEKEMTVRQIVENTYVTRAFSGAGVELKREAAEEADTPATILNIYIPKTQEETFNKAIAEGTLRISRVVE